jgi:hypothetical protein
MSSAKSEVQVSIVAQLGSGFTAAFREGDRRLQAFSQTVRDTNKIIGNIDAYRKQQEAAKQAGYAWQAAKVKAEQFRDAIASQGAPTRKQAADLARLERAAASAGEKFARQRTLVGEMAQALQKAGVNTGQLAAEYQRLKTQLDASMASHTRLEASLHRQHRIVRAMSATWQRIAGAAGGMVAAGAVLSGPGRQAMDYDKQLTYMADTAAAGKGKGAFQSAKQQISDAIDAAIKGGGGKREDAATALNALIASGQFELPDALQQLKSVSRTAFASGATAEDLAKTTIAMRQFGIKDPGAEYDKLLRAGQLGNFELRDMARFLPQQMALARSAGYSGTGGLTDLLAFNQVAMKTAGTQDEAGNNVVNLLQKLSSREFSDSVAKVVKVQRGDPTSGKKGGFDWSTYAMQQREKGVSSIDAFTMLVDRQVNADPRYKALQKKLAGTSNSEDRKATLQAMSEMAMGSDIGKLIADRQALMAALAALYGRDNMKQLRTGIGQSSGAVDQSSANVRGETWAKQVDAANSVARANEQAFNSVSGPLGKLLDVATDLAREFPKLATAAYGATVALGAVAAFGAGRGLMGAATGAAGAGAAAGGLAGMSRFIRFGGPALAVAGSGLAAYSIATDPNLTDAQKNAGYTGVGGGLAGAGAGALAGGMVAGPFGAIAGGILGGLGGGAAGNWLGAKIFDSSAAAAESAKAASEAATAAQSRPNVTQNNSYSVVVNPAAPPGSLEASEMFTKAMREHERKRDAELRGSFFGQPQY